MQANSANGIGGSREVLSVSVAILGVFAAMSLKAYDSSSYAQDGLVAQWDGVDNAGAEAEHNASATQWIDLKHGYAFQLTGVTVGTDHLAFAGASTSYAMLDETASAAAFPGATNTVEICFTFDKAADGQVVLKGPSGSNAGYATYKDNGSWVLTHNRIKAYCFNGVGYAGTNTVALSYIQDNALANLFLFNGESQREVTSKTAWFGMVGGTANANAWLGVNQAKGNAFKGKIYAVRVYNRVLTAEEAQRNSAIDRQRFANRADWSVREIPVQAYDNVHACQPAVSVTNNEADAELALGTDYTVTYEDNAAPGTGYAVVTPKAPHPTAPIRVPFGIRLADSVRRTCVWTNTVTATAQAWSDAANWKDLDNDGTGDVPRPGDDVRVEAAASINFAGAHFGTLTHTAGALTLDFGNGVATNGADLVSTGASVTIQNGTIFLTAGEHVLSNTCTVTHKQVSKVPAYFTGPGGLTKKGAGTLTYAGDALDLYTFTGPLKVCGGMFQTQGYGSSSFFGPREIVVDGATLSVRKTNQLNLMHTVRVLNRGALSLTGEHYLHRLFINGMGCAIGKWGSSSATGVDHKSTRITSATWIYPQSGPKENAYAPGPELVWSGETKHWKGTVSTAWKTAANWEEGIVPESLDDIVVPAGTPYACVIPSENAVSWTFHTLTTEQNLSTSGWRLTLNGDLHLNGGNLTIYPTITFSSGTHVIDGSGTLTLKWHSSLSYVFGGDGNIIKRGTGSVTTGDYTSAPFAHTGYLQVEGGTFKLGNAGNTMPNCREITVTGAGAALQISSAALNSEAVVSVRDNGTLNLNGTFTNVVKKLYLDGYSKGKGHTYGSTVSSAERKRVAFAGKGALLPTEDDSVTGAFLRLH